MDDNRRRHRRSEQRSAHRWTAADAYVAALARKRTARRLRESDPGSQHEAPRFPVSMLPFVALMIMLAVLVIATIIIAFPGTQPRPKPRQVETHELGYAPKGWLEEAEKQFH